MTIRFKCSCYNCYLFLSDWSTCWNSFQLKSSCTWFSDSIWLDHETTISFMQDVIQLNIVLPLYNWWRNKGKVQNITVVALFWYFLYFFRSFFPLFVDDQFHLKVCINIIYQCDWSRLKSSEIRFTKNELGYPWFGHILLHYYFSKKINVKL